MSKVSGQLHPAGKTADIAPGAAKQVRVSGRVLALYNLNGTYYATDDTCTHAFASLSEGYIDGDTVECPLHQGCFHIPSGKAVAPPVTQDVRAYPVKVVDGDIYVELPEGDQKP